KNAQWQWQELLFVRSQKVASEALALVADQTLTLGFTPGQGFAMPSFLKTFQLLTRKPASVDFPLSPRLKPHPDRRVTRLFASTVEQGRLVWMDHLPTSDPENRLMASIFRFLLKKKYRAIATWPFGRLYAAAIA